MENSPPNGKFPWSPNSRFSAKEGRSGYEPSDTETEWQELPRHKRERKNLNLGHEEAKVLNLRKKSPMALHRKHPSSKFEPEISSSTSSVASSAGRRPQSRSPYRPFRAADGEAPYPITGLDNVPTSVSPVTKPEFARRHTSPYPPERENLNWRAEKPNQRRAMTAPMQRGGREREASSHGTNPSIGEINEMVAEAKFTRDSINDELIITSTESSLAGDIFFSRECNALTKQKTLLTKPPKLEFETQFISSRPNKVLPQRGTPFHNQHQNRANGNVNNVNIQGTSSSSTTMLSRSSTASSNGAKSKKNSGNLSASGSVKGDVGWTSVSNQKFMMNRKKNQAETWFACMRRVGRSSNKSPEHRSVDEASIIYKAFVLQSLPQFWADKHQPTSLDGFICHQQEAQLLKELVSF